MDSTISSHPDYAALSHTQKVQLQLIYDRRFNQFDGPRVVDDLINNKSLWIAALMTRSTEQLGVGITLRDLPANYYNVDTLYLTTNSITKLKKLAKKWEADEISEIEDPGSFLGSYPPKMKVLCLWWD